MGRRRTLLLPTDAKTEGGRLLRELLRRQSYAQIARRLRCSEGAIRNYAHEDREPDLQMRGRFAEVFGWDESVWFEKPSTDAYSSDDPKTERKK